VRDHFLKAFKKVRSLQLPEATGLDLVWFAAVDFAPAKD
jgi:hypothetical protein